MQPKISCFFKPHSTSTTTTKFAFSVLEEDIKYDDDLALWEKTEHNFFNTYQRRRPYKHSEGVDRSGGDEGPVSKMGAKPISENPCTKLELGNSGKVLNKKRNYAQLHLELGQSDFHLHTCSICEFKYTPGDEEDEKDHKTFHKNYAHGIPFRVSMNERVVCMPCVESGQIVLVSDCDHPALRNKVDEVVRMMEIELGAGWIYHELCKVYLFIFSQRVAGCLVAEPIKEAFKVLSCSGDKRCRGASMKDSKSNSMILQFGEITFHREAKKKAPSAISSGVFDGNHNGAIICEDKPIPAVCGIRAIWVTPGNRRKHIGSQLLDAARRSFCMGFAIEQSQLAFSPPTAAGRALASSYTGTDFLLLYKPRAPKPSVLRNLINL